MDNISLLNSFAFLIWAVGYNKSIVWLHVVSVVLLILCVILFTGKIWFAYKHRKHARKARIIIYIVMDLLGIACSICQFAAEV